MKVGRRGEGWCVPNGPFGGGFIRAISPFLLLFPQKVVSRGIVARGVRTRRKRESAGIEEGPDSQSDEIELSRIRLRPPFVQLRER